MSKSSEEARQWMNNNVNEDDEMGYRYYNEAMNELFIVNKHEQEEKDYAITR